MEIASKGRLTTHKNYDVTTDLEKIATEMLGSNNQNKELNKTEKAALKKKRKRQL